MEIVQKKLFISFILLSTLSSSLNSWAMIEKYQATNPYNVPDATEEDYVLLKDPRQKSPLYRLIFIPLACGFIVPWIHGCIHLYKYHFVDPQHKEKYEKPRKIKKHLEAAMETPYRELT